MAFKFYGGSTPAPAAEWTCPSCGHEQAGPLKAGCQKCGAGADARKVGLPDGHQQALHAPEAATGEDPEAATPVAGGAHRERALQAAADAAAAWLTTHNIPDNPRVAVANAETVKEAFMAGVAWAQAQAVATERAAMTAAGFPPPTTAPEPAPTHAALWLDDGKHQDPVSPEAAATILAALAFYRDNVLAYGGMPGQLGAEQVTDLITRLQPQEQEA